MKYQTTAFFYIIRNRIIIFKMRFFAGKSGFVVAWAILQIFRRIEMCNKKNRKNETTVLKLIGDNCLVYEKLIINFIMISSKFHPMQCLASMYSPY